MDTSNITINDLLVILDITRRLAEQRMVQPLLEYVATTVFELIPAERCLIVLFGEEDTLNVLVARNRQGQTLDAAADQVSRSILDHTRQMRAPQLINDAISDELFQSSQSVRALGLRAVMCVPLISYGVAIGAIYVENRLARARFSEGNLVPLVLFSGQVVSALELIKAYQSLEERVAERTRELQEANTQLAQQAAELTQISLRDSLTGLYNRRHFHETINQQFEVSRRYKRSLAIAYVDIDNFKHINDTYTHDGGDHVLIKVAHLLQEQIRSADLVARIGGEEFAIMMPETPIKSAHFACNRLRIAIEAVDWSSIAPDLHVTISIGIATDTECSDVHELLRFADSRLYAAKRNGKNLVVSEDVPLLIL